MKTLILIGIVVISTVVYIKYKQSIDLIAKETINKVKKLFNKWT